MHNDLPLNPPRGRIYDSILDTIGATPLVRIEKMAQKAKVKAQILGKCEFFNPLASVKDRIGYAMIADMEQKGLIHPDSTLIEPTSGNTGIALAFVCAAKGYRLILTMPETMSEERRKMLRYLGAELVLTDGHLGIGGAVKRAEELRAEIPNSAMPMQFENAANVRIHELTTAEEIWHDTKGQVDLVISGVGTGGTLTGVGAVLKARKPTLKMIAVEPENSPILSGGQPGPHKIQGIGAGFIPPILNTALIDEVLCISNETAFHTARTAASSEGLPVGISSGAALAAALEIGVRPDLADKMIVVILPSFAERYLSTELFAS